MYIAPTFRIDLIDIFYLLGQNCLLFLLKLLVIDLFYFFRLFGMY